MPRYTDERRAEIVAMMIAEGWPDTKGAASKVSREVGIPRMTITRWAKKVSNPPPNKIVRIKKEGLADRFETIALLAQDVVIEALSDPELAKSVDPKDATIIAATATDKHRLLTGKSTDNNAVEVVIRYADD